MIDNILSSKENLHVPFCQPAPLDAPSSLGSRLPLTQGPPLLINPVHKAPIIINRLYSQLVHKIRVSFTSCICQTKMHENGNETSLLKSIVRYIDHFEHLSSIHMTLFNVKMTMGSTKNWLVLLRSTECVTLWWGKTHVWGNQIFRCRKHSNVLPQHN